MTITPFTFRLHHTSSSATASPLVSTIPAAYLVQDQSLLVFKDTSHAVVFAIPVHDLVSVERLPAALPVASMASIRQRG